jgi:hypothetical protein
MPEEVGDTDVTLAAVRLGRDIGRPIQVAIVLNAAIFGSKCWSSLLDGPFSASSFQACVYALTRSSTMIQLAAR